MITAGNARRPAGRPEDIAQCGSLPSSSARHGMLSGQMRQAPPILKFANLAPTRNSVRKAQKGRPGESGDVEGNLLLRAGIRYADDRNHVRAFADMISTARTLGLAEPKAPQLNRNRSPASWMKSPDAERAAAVASGVPAASDSTSSCRRPGHGPRVRADQ